MHVYNTMVDLESLMYIMHNVPHDTPTLSSTTPSSSSASAPAPALVISTSVVAFDLRARPLPGPAGFALAFEA